MKLYNLLQTGKDTLSHAGVARFKITFFENKQQQVVYFISGHNPEYYEFFRDSEMRIL